MVYMTGEARPIHPADLIPGLDAEKMVQVLEAIKVEIDKATTVPKECKPGSPNHDLMTEADLEFDKKQALEMTDALIVFFEGYVAR